MTGPSVLVVDDERNLARAIKLFLADAGYQAEVASDAEQALEMLQALQPDVVFADVRLPGMNGIELLRRIRELDPSIPVIMMTAYGTIEGAVEAVKLGAFDYLKKPVDLEELKLLADRARETSLLKQELSYYRRRDVPDSPFASLMGDSPAIRAVTEQARQIAALDETPPVLIIGETGTGKNLVARSIHAAGARASRAFIEVNCTALPASLMEAELFGHERGAFTDAKQSKMGLFEAAEGGFLFLDEVGDIELQLQGKLLRAIEERVTRRVGGLRDRRIDVRILAATNRDLESEAHQGAFRKDLYFRLAVILLRLPPLRERGEDVLILAEHFLRKFRAKYGRDVREIGPAARDLLLAYPWPGNVRELSHVIERAVLWSHGPALATEHLSLSAPAGNPTAATPPISEPTSVPTSVPASAPHPAATPTPGADNGGAAHSPLPVRPQAESAAPMSSAAQPLPTDLAGWERAMIENALREAGGNQTRAAERLGISRDTLRYRLKKFGIRG